MINYNEITYDELFDSVNPDLVQAAANVGNLLINKKMTEHYASRYSQEKLIEIYKYNVQKFVERYAAQPSDTDRISVEGQLCRIPSDPKERIRFNNDLDHLSMLQSAYNLGYDNENNFTK